MGFQFRVLPFPFYVIHGTTHFGFYWSYSQSNSATLKENHKETEWRIQFLDESSGLRNATADLWEEFKVLKAFEINYS